MATMSQPRITVTYQLHAEGMGPQTFHEASVLLPEAGCSPGQVLHDLASQGPHEHLVVELTLLIDSIPTVSCTP